MENPRPEKVAVVSEVREKLSETEAVVFTEYRGLSVADLQQLRGELAEAGGEYKVYKNTLVRRATAEIDLDLGEILTGPTALALVSERPDGTPGDAVLVAKALKKFAKTNPNLVVKGGRLGEQMLDTDAVMALADVAPREELLARFAAGLAAPMTNMARLMQALPQKMAYALTALIDQGGGPAATPETDAATSDPDGTAEAPDGTAEASGAEAADGTAEASGAEAADETADADGAAQDNTPEAQDSAAEAQDNTPEAQDSAAEAQDKE